MKTLTLILSVIIFTACGNSANEDKGTETPTVTPSSTVTSDTATANSDTMMQPNGVSNGTVTADSTDK